MGIKGKVEKKEKILYNSKEVKKEKIECEIEGLIKRIGAEVKIKKIRKIRNGKEGGGEMMMVKLGLWIRKQKKGNGKKEGKRFKRGKGLVKT